jgi:tRNA pseudouridine55 synthase
MEGVINLDKPAGISSAAAVNRVKRLLPRGTRIGHAGTLDPFATGVLLLLIGKATRSSNFFLDEPKSYETIVKFGATTPTDDSESEECTVIDAVPPDLQSIRAAAESLIGTHPQLPPAFSAKKIAGQRAYAIARSGKPVSLQPQLVRIDKIEILHWQWPLLRLSVDCGRGTYIRSIARDLGNMLKTGGHLTQLRRTRIGRFVADESVSLEVLLHDGAEKYLQPVNPPE